MSESQTAHARLYGFSIRGIADGDHWTGDGIGPALFQHAEQLIKLAAFRHDDPSASQLFRHASPRFAQPRLVVLVFRFNLLNESLKCSPHHSRKGASMFAICLAISLSRGTQSSFPHIIIRTM